MPSIVSLIASGTEWVCALGWGHALVGISHECDHPAWVSRLPRLTKPRIPVGGTSAEIDALVKREAEHRLSLYNVDAPALAALRPTHIVTQTHCDVCAVSGRDVESALAACGLSSGPDRPKVVSLRPDSLEDVWTGARELAAALGDGSSADRAIGHLRARMDALAAGTANFGQRPTVAMIEWIEPLMAGGNWTPELVAFAGGRSVLGEAGAHSPEIPLERLAAANPDVIVVTPCGFDLQRTERELPALSARPEWKRLRAVREGRAYVADGNAFFNRPGPRLVESAEILAEILHRDRLAFGHSGTAWRAARTD